MAKALKETTAKEPTMLDRALTIKPTPRVERLKKAFLRSKTTVSINIARIETRVMKETEGEPTITRRAKVFAAVAREMPIDIFPDELIAGCISTRLSCWEVSPANGPALEEMLSTSRPYLVGSLPGTFKGSWDPNTLSNEEKREVREELIPYWKGAGKYEKTMTGRNYQQIPKHLPQLADLLPNRRVSVDEHYGHNCIGYEKVLKKGFLGIKREAEERLAELDSTETEEAEKALFLEGVITAMEAAAEAGKRFAARARELAENEEDTRREAELLKIAEVCNRVPANPARTFYEALQSYHFTWVLLFWEQPTVRSVSPGRADQYLYPYYERDIREGQITKEEAQELIDCYIIKLNQKNYESLSTHISVGGFKANGNDATNELTYMFIEAMMHTRLNAPIFSVQVHNKMPDDLLIKACQLCSLGTSHPQFINSDVLVDQALARGSLGGPAVTLEDARSATPIGCLELAIPAKDSGYWFIGGLSNLAACMEFVMTNGVRRFDQKKIGLETGDPRQFKSFEEVEEAFRKQVAWGRRNSQISGNITERIVAEIAPTVYESALIENCIEEGICRELGGAYYNFSNQLLPVGSNDAADSLTAIKKLVFKDKKITIDELCDALDRNFEGYEELRQMLLKTPKFGNDNDYADKQATFVSHVIASEATRLKKNLRGGYGGVCGGSAWSLEAMISKVVGALPSGRRAGQPLNDAHSPCAGSDLKGPTAILKSMGKIDNVELMAGVILNMRIDPAVFKNKDGIKRLAGLIRVFIDQRIYHVQFNIVSSDTLRAAQKEPEKYQDLLVKVAGYSAFFVTLMKPAQDAIIARTEHRL